MKNFELKEVEKMVNTNKELNEQLEVKDVELQEYKDLDNNIKTAFLKEIEQLKADVSNKDNTINELMEESDSLRALISELRVTNYKLNKEAEQMKTEIEELRVDNGVLHNENEDSEVDNDEQGGWSEEDTILMAQIYAEAEKDYKF